MTQFVSMLLCHAFTYRFTHSRCVDKKITPFLLLKSRFSHLGIIGPQWHKPFAESQIILSVCFQIWVKAISWWRENMCVLCMYEGARQCVGVRVCVCAFDGFTICRESPYGTKWSRIWKKLSDLGYCRKTSFYYLLLLPFLFILLFLHRKIAGHPGYIY